MAYMRLGELLIAAGTISQEELDRGLELQKGTKDRLGDVIECFVMEEIKA